MAPRFVPLKTRFDQKWRLDPDSGCWIWEGERHYPSGYGRIGIGSGKTRMAHRIGWEIYRGPIPDGFVLDHLCRRRDCVNPAHLEPVPPSENGRRAWLVRGTSALTSPFIKKKRPAQFERFNSKWKRNSDNGCWEWQAALTKNGYGVARHPVWGSRAHRVSYFLYKGPIPDGLHIDHLCRNRKCVNPDHLEVVTITENNRRAKGWAYQKAKTHCPRGHLYDDANTFFRHGWRMCRACKRQSDSRKYKRPGKKGVPPGTHCKRGHPFSGENLRINKATGQRICRTCHREWRLERKATHSSTT